MLLSKIVNQSGKPLSFLFHRRYHRACSTSLVNVLMTDVRWDDAKNMLKGLDLKDLASACVVCPFLI